MVVYKCDRCGKTLSRFETPKAAVKANRTCGGMIEDALYVIAADYEFCSRCKGQLHKMYKAWESEFVEWMNEEEEDEGPGSV